MTSVKLKTSTPNVSRLVELTDAGQSPDVSEILLEHSTSKPILISDDSITKIEDNLFKQCAYNQPGPSSSITILENTFLKRCACGHVPEPHAASCNKCVRIQEHGEVEELFFKGKVEETAVGRGGGVIPARVYESQSTSMLQGRCPAKVKSEDKRRILKEHESLGRSSEVDSPTSSCASARAHYYHNKLLATLQVLQNKEETVRVQTESLAVAEGRIASLTARSVELKREIERKGRELKTLRESIQKSQTEKSDVSITAQIQEIDNQKNIVTTLQSNLGVIEDLYRECFYETAKQEGLIEMLRKSYLDVRLMDKEKSDQISRLHNVINTQKWSLDKCQDIASDVDNLKVEISNFLNSSNNDSGVWEETLAGDLTEDLQDISGQLISLRELLTGDCTCGLEEENRSLRQNNEAMEKQIEDLRQKIEDLETILENKDTVDRQNLEQIRAKENELHLIRQQLAAVECDTRERGQTCETVKMQLHQTQVVLEHRTAELTRVETLCQQHEDTIRRLTEEIEQSKEISKEYCALRGSTCAAQRRVRVLRAELAKALQHCEHLDACRREVRMLERALGEAQAGGAALCAEARRAARAVRAWTRHSKDAHREQDAQIKQQQSRIRLLELRLEQAQNDSTLTRGSENDTCNKCTTARSINSERNNARSKSSSFERNSRHGKEEPSCSKCPQVEGSYTSCSRVRQGRERGFELSASEMGSSTSPVPPQRPSRMKRFFCENGVFSSTREASVQRPERTDAATGSVDSGSEVSSRNCRRYHVGHVHANTTPSALSGSVEEVVCRVERAGAALADSLRRWNRPRPLHYPTPEHSTLPHT